MSGLETSTSPQTHPAPASASASARTLVEDLYQALAAGDRPAVEALLHPDFVGWTTPGLPLGLGGEYRGPDAMITGFWWRIGAAYRARAVPEHVTDTGDGSLLVRGRYLGSARGGGPLDAWFVHEVTTQDGRITSLRQLTDSQRWVEALPTETPEPAETPETPEPSEAQPVLGYSAQEGLVTLTLDRPDHRNAMDEAMADELLAAAHRLRLQPGLRAVLIQASGATFSVGGDIEVFAAAPPQELPATLLGMVSSFHRALAVLDALPVPVVVAARGAVAGGALGLLHVADIALVAEGTRFAAGFGAIGLTGDGASTWFLPRLIGPKRAADFYLTGRVVDAEEALAWGLVSRVVADDALDDQARELAARLAAGPTVALGGVRALLRRSWEVSLAEQLAAEVDGIVTSSSSADAAGAVRTFLAKQRPTFTGE